MNAISLVEDTPHRLVYRVRTPLQEGIGVLGAFFLSWLAWHWWTRNPNQERFAGLIGAASTCLLFALFSETGDYVFDAQIRRLTWSRRIGLRHRSGSVSFADIEQVVVRTALGSDSMAPSQRVVLLTRNGELPLSAGYTPGDAHAKDAERLREFLGKSQAEALRDNIADLIRLGRDIDAIRELRLARGISLEEAKTEIERFRSVK